MKRIKKKKTSNSLLARHKAETAESVTTPTGVTAAIAKEEGDPGTKIAVAEEDRALAAYHGKRAATTVMPRAKVEMKWGVAHVSLDHANQEAALACVANAFGSGSTHFASGLIRQLADVSRSGPEVKENELEFMMTVVRAFSPQDETEALLAAQMAAVHMATMNVARRFNHVESIPQQDSASNALNKLARTFATQVETLKRYRSGPEGGVQVQRVTVNDGGQAIVGSNIHHGGDNANPNPATPQSCGAPAPGAALLSNVQADTPAVPSAGGKG